jgi:CDP-diacylglycerol---serine O-phosphatidyltransferase
MISNVATLSWSSLRPRRTIRLWVILLIGLLSAALLLEPWWTLVAISAGYLTTLPVGMLRYAKVKRQRAAARAESPAAYS